MKYKINKKYILVELLAVIALVSFDIWTKIWAVSSFQGKENFIVFPNVLQFTYLENKGAAFGVLKNQQILFMIIGIVCAFVAVYFMLKIPTVRKYIYLRVTIVLIVAGAIGNFIDRSTLNYVRDFIYFSYIDFPVFNVADIYVTCGTVLLALLILFYYKDDDLNFKKHRTIKLHSSMISDEEKN